MTAIDPQATEQALAARAAFAGSAAVAAVPAADLKEHYARIVADHEASAKRARREERGRWWFTGLLGGCVAALGAALAVALPLKQLLPVFVHQHADGSWTTSIAQSDTPAPLRQNVVKATLWLYVTSAERYNTATHWQDQQLVYTLSDGPTGDAHQARVDYKSKNSPWKQYGTRGTVRVERVSESLGCGTEACAPGQDPNSYAVRFRRIEKREGQRETCVQRQATLRFRQPEKVPQSQLVTSNPMGLQVVEYTWTDEGSAEGCAA